MLNSSLSTTFILVTSSFDRVLVNIILEFTYHSVSWTIRETCWFVNNVYYHFVRWRKITKIKVVYLDELYIFGIHQLFSWNHLVFQNLVRTCHFLKLKIWIAQTLSKKKMTKSTRYLIGHDFRKFLGKNHHIWS